MSSVFVKKKLFSFLPPFSLTSFANFQKILEKGTSRKVSQKSLSQPQLILPTTAHEGVMAFFSRELRTKLAQFDFLTPDGMPLVWLGKLHFFRTERIYGPDLMESFFSSNRTVTGTKKPSITTHFLYGGTPPSLRRLQQILSKKGSRSRIVGSYAPPFRELSENEKKKVIAQINILKPDFVWVGLGGEKQIRWALDMKPVLRTRYIVGVGAAFDFLSQTKPQAPRWMRETGLEWFFRLCTEPGRLWKRYVLQIPIFLVLFIFEVVKLLLFDSLFLKIYRKLTGKRH